jgi:hypothetical protein
MMRLFALVCFAALMACSQANAQQQVRFIGSFVFLSATGCPDFNPTGDRGFARFRPVVVGSSNGSRARVGLFFQDGAQGWEANAGNFTAAFKAANFGNVFDGPGFQPSNQAPVPRLRFIFQAPANITTTTQTVTIVAEAQNFDFQPGCTPRFRMVLQRRPN